MAVDMMRLFDFKLLLPRGWDIKLSPRFLTYEPSFEINIETPNYILKTAKITKELLEVFELRYQIFLEATEKSSKLDGYDLDEFDSICDHIIILDKKDNKRVIGTYRIISSVVSEKFYSQTEFNLDEFLAQPGEKLELGRACIHHKYRNGAVIDLLWKGIAKYVELTNSKYLFGCSSIKTISSSIASGMTAFLKEDSLYSDKWNIRPLPSFSIDLSEKNEEYDAKRMKDFLPPLLRSYFSAGARVFGEPALDREFECIDFLTIIDTDELSRSYKRRYFSA